MAMYYFNIRTDSHVASRTEYETDDLTSLRIELARFVGEVLKDHAELIWQDQRWQVDVTDATDLILYVIHLDASETSATAGTIPRK
jgi:hypothetical protein